jgi:Ca2+-binding RTX toxin-like protein
MRMQFANVHAVKEEAVDVNFQGMRAEGQPYAIVVHNNGLLIEKQLYQILVNGQRCRFIISAGNDTVTDFNNVRSALGPEILQVSSEGSVKAVLKSDWTASSASFNNGGAILIGSGLDIDLTAIDQGLGWTLTNYGKAASFKGSIFDDVMNGGVGNDYLMGSDGDDTLNGGQGWDILSGGTGADTFRLSGDVKTDHINDFLSGTDRIELDNALFKALLTEGQLAANQFAQGAAATTATQRIVYDQPTGNLWYDLDGAAKGKAVLIAVLDNHVKIAYTDFWVI